jgi:glucose/arabinose dehydrogenase
MKTNRIIIAMALASTAMLAACGSDGSGDGGIITVPGGGTPTPSPTPTPTPAPTPTPTPTATYSAVDVGPNANYTAIAILPDGRSILSAADGTVAIGDIEGTPAVAGRLPVFDGAGGIVGIAVDPSFATTGRVFFSVTEGVGPTLTDVNMAVVRAVVSNGALTQATTIFRTAKATVRSDLARFGGTIVVDPSNGELLVAYGDLGDPDAAQNPGSFKGKILRMTQDGAKSVKSPTSTGSLDYVYASGLRLPTSLTVTTDGTIIFVDKAPNKGDEVDVVKQGVNYGWPLVSEGSDAAFNDYPRHATRSDVEAPVFSTTLAQAFTGILQVRTAQLGLKDEYLLSTFNSGIFRLTPNGRNLRETGARITNNISFLGSIAEKPDGNVYVISTAFNYRAQKLVRN